MTLNRDSWIKYTGEGLASAAMGAAIGVHDGTENGNVHANTLDLLDAARDYALRVYCHGIDPRVQVAEEAANGNG